MVRFAGIAGALAISALALGDTIEPVRTSVTAQLPPAAERSGVPEPPRSSVDVKEPGQSGRRIHVPAKGDVQAAIDEAKPGDTITLEAGATYTGPFRLRPKTGSGWIVVTTSKRGALPRFGERVAPSHARAMPRLESRSASVIEADAGAHHYRLLGLEIAPARGEFLYQLVTLGDNESDVSQLPHDIVIDRCYIHGDPRVGGRRGVAMNSVRTAVMGSYLSDFKESGADSQAIAGWNGPGPFTITNNYLEAAGENVMFGGADPAVDGLVPADIEVTLNHMAKPLRWMKGHDSFEGTNWTVKNLFELKNARRVLIDRNLLEYNWVDAQNGFAILFTVRNQDGRAPWSTVEDVMFSGNLVRHVGAGINILGHDDVHPSGPAQRITIRNNLFEDVGGRWGSGRLFQLLAGARHITIDRNTAYQTGSVLTGGDTAPHPGFAFTRNVVPHNQYGITGSGTASGKPSLEKYFPAAVVRGNVIVGGDPAIHPPGNHFPKTLPDARRIEHGAGADVQSITATARRVASADRHVAGAAEQPTAKRGSGVVLVFLGSFLLLGYVYVGYPGVTWLLARLRPRHRVTANIQPTVTIVIVAHNEDDRIDRRIENLLALDYPRELVEILIGSDGSTDATVHRASRYADSGVKVYAFAERRGKAAVLNDLAARASGEVLVFGDARQTFAADVLSVLVSRFADPAVGAVSGELILTTGPRATAIGRGAGFYWRYEKFIRSNESRWGSTLCATGAIYAIRRALFEPIPADTILDDVLIPARIARRGYAVQFEPAAKAYDSAPVTPRQEHVRKARTIAGNFQLFAREPWLLDPRRNPLWFSTISHRGLRLTLPVLHVALLASNVALADGVLFMSLLTGQVAFYAIALAAHVLTRFHQRIAAFAVPYAMCLMLCATVAGFLRFAAGRQLVMWERVRPAAVDYR